MAPGQPGEPPPDAAIVAALLAEREGYTARRPRSLRAHSPCAAPFASASASIFASRV
jgi:hypothetical protein